MHDTHGNDLNGSVCVCACVRVMVQCLPLHLCILHNKTLLECPSVFLTSFLLDQVLAGALLNSLGALVRLISSLPAVNNNPSLYYNAGYAVAMCGQILTAAAQPFILYAPTKFAMLWFGDRERGIPTALASMGQCSVVCE